MKRKIGKKILRSAKEEEKEGKEKEDNRRIVREQEEATEGDKISDGEGGK